MRSLCWKRKLRLRKCGKKLHSTDSTQCLDFAFLPREESLSSGSYTQALAVEWLGRRAVESPPKPLHFLNDLDAQFCFPKGLWDHADSTLRATITIRGSIEFRGDSDRHKNQIKGPVPTKNAKHSRSDFLLPMWE